MVVLGSATPSLESYYNCGKGKYTLLELPERADDKKMPVVRIVDMRQTVRAGQSGSHLLAAAQGGHRPAARAARSRSFCS